MKARLQTAFQIAILLAGLGFGLGAASSVHAGGQVPQGPSDPLPPSPITNFHVVTAGVLYRGARPGEDGLAYLKSIGIRTVVDLQGGDPWLSRLFDHGESPQAISEEGQEAVLQQMQFFSRPLDPNALVDYPEALRIENILSILHDPKNQPVYVHCAHGIDRTGLIVALYRTRFEGWSYEQAHDEMIALGHGFLNQQATLAMDLYLKQAAQECVLCELGPPKPPDPY